MKHLCFLAFFSIILYSCHSNSESKTTSENSAGKSGPVGYNVKELSGVFYDTFPCADCAGIVTTLYLKPDSTFITESQYLKKNVLYETGTWNLQDSVLQLSGTDSSHLYKIKSHALLEVLDADGKEINVAPKKLELHRNNVPFKPVHSIPMDCMYNAAGDTMHVHICSMKKDYPASLAPTAMIMTAKYKQAAKQGEPVFAQVAGHFELRPSLKDTTTEDFFVIEKFIKFSPGQQCK